MDVNTSEIYLVGVSGVSPWNSIHLSGCSRDWWWDAVSFLLSALLPFPGCCLMQYEGSLPARLPAVPPCLALTHPFSCLPKCAKLFLTWGLASSSLCSPSSWGSSYRWDPSSLLGPALRTKLGSWFVFEPLPILFLLFLFPFTLGEEHKK